MYLLFECVLKFTLISYTYINKLHSIWRTIEIIYTSRNIITNCGSYAYVGVVNINN